MECSYSFFWNKHDVCENPWVYDFGKKREFTCRVSIARISGLWRNACHLGYKDHGRCGPVNISSPAFTCQRDAVVAGLYEAVKYFESERAKKIAASLEKIIEDLKSGNPLPEPKQNMQQTNIIDADTGKELPMEETGSNNPQTSMAVAARATAISPQDAESAQRISGLYAEALHGLRKVVFCGAEMLEQKARMKHGQFLPWLESNCPEIPARTAQQFMACAKAAVCLGLNKKSYSQIRNDCVFDNIPISKILQLPAAELSPAAAKAQEQIFELVDGKTQKQLLFDFRDSEPPKRQYNPPVRTKGELEQIKQAADEQVVKDVTESLLMLDNQKLARCSDDTLKALRNALDYVKGRLPKGK